MKAKYPRKRALCQRITITVRGVDDAAMETAKTEVLRLIGLGYVLGADSNGEGGFYFDVSNDVPPGEVPA